MNKFLVCLLCCSTVFANVDSDKLIEMRVVNYDSGKTVVIEKENGERITLKDNETIITKFKAMSTVKAYVNNEHICDWDISSNNQFKGLYFGWFGNHPSLLGCAQTAW